MTLPRPADAVIFDMDGLLLDTERIYSAALMQAASAMGFAMPESFCHSMIGIPSPQCDAMIRRHYGPAFPMTEFSRAYDRHLVALTANGIPVKAGAAELVTLLAARRMPRAIATSSSRRTVDRHLGRSGLLDHFPIVVTRDDVAHGKPHPDVYLRAAERLGIAAAQCVALEDSHNGIRAAHAAGTMPIMVPDIVAPSEEIRGLCIAVVADLHEARRLLGLT